MESRLRASPRHGGQGCLILLIFWLPIRHGGAPSGVAALIIFDEQKGNNSRIEGEKFNFQRIYINTDRSEFLIMITIS